MPRPQIHPMPKLKLILGAALVAILFAGCSSLISRDKNDGSRRFSDDQKHRLYSAALAASDSPMDTKAFTDVCRTIGIFDTKGKPNDRYIIFVSQHVNWANGTETEDFRREIDSKEKARAYIAEYLTTAKE
jgi:hypothetical protein